MNQIPKFHRTLTGGVANKMEVSYWNVALDTHQNKDYKASFYALMDYIDPQLRKKFGNDDQTYFEVPHGSIVVHIKLVEDRIEIHAPFIELPETNAVPVLRKITEINFTPLNLAAIRLKGNFLEFHYSCKMSAFEPY